MESIKNFIQKNKSEIIAGVAVGAFMFGAINFFNILPKPQEPEEMYEEEVEIMVEGEDEEVDFNP